MAAKTAVNGPLPHYPGPNEENLQSHANSVQHDPGTSQNPGSSSRHHHPVYDRPVFNIHAPPPPPFLQYQWPMPFFYNPFAGFPGMGYGMVMPPFPPPPPYIEAPAYILPQPHILPVDYRRLLQPQVHTSAVPPQNPNQAHRMRLPRSVPVRETVNFGVQTEPTQRGETGYNEGCPLISDSGQGTASDTPSSSCSSQRRGSAEVEKYPLPHSNAKDAQVSWPLANIKITHGFKILHPAGINAVQSSLSATQETQDRCKDGVGQEPPLIPYWSNGHCNMSTVSSPDSRAPLCSSPQREDEVVKERRISVPDILMSWGSGTPQTATLLNSLNASHKLPGDEQEKGNETNLQEDTEIIPYQMGLNSCQMKRKINESVWSVESLAPYIPTKEWLLQNGMFEPEVFDVAVETENGRLSIEIDNLIVEGKERRRARRFSSSDSQVSQSSLIFRTPAEKLSPPYRPEMETETDISKKEGPDQDQTMAPSEKEKDLLVSPLPLSKNLSPLTEEDVDENGSSEPEANQSPNQESITVNELIVQSRTDTEVGEGAVNSEMRKEEPCVPMADQRMPEVSQSKGHLVDCGVQCSEFKCPCGESKDCMEPNKRHPSKYSDMKKANMQKHLKRNGLWRNKALDKNSSQQEVYCGHAGKLVKSKGGNGRNLRS